MYWALFANPNIYRIEEAVLARAEDTWPTAGKAMHVGDRVLIWRGRGREGRRGIVALGEVRSEPEPLDDSGNPFWVEAHEAKTEPRVRVRYSIPAGLPLWLDEHEETLGQLSVARAKGGTVFNVTEEHWERVLDLANNRGRPRGSAAPSEALRGVKKAVAGEFDNSRSATRSPASTTWLLLTFGDERQYAGNLGYEDDPALVYRYDNFVPNHRHLVEGDMAVLKASDRALGCARIERIERHEGTKERQRCPTCKTTALKERRTRTPRYRCDGGHEFDNPLTEQVECEKIAAYFGDSFVRLETDVDAAALRAACRNYNGQLAMQRIDRGLIADGTSLLQVDGALRRIESAMVTYPQPDDGAVEPVDANGSDPGIPYAPSGLDTRDAVLRQVRTRRGQGAFRQHLRAAYGDACMVTGCTLVDLLEAAHISPYRGADDHHVENGLLLRADIHTLFDLDLLGIEPETLVVRVHRCLGDAGYADLDGRALARRGLQPSRSALESRWAAFQRRCTSP